MSKEKSQAELTIEDMKDVFDLATTGFEEHYKTCEKNSKGTNSKSASSGYNSTSASSGYNSTSASSGDNSTSASSGDNSKSASSGNNSKSASSGYNSKSASSGYNSTSASCGDNSTSASSGDNSKSASSGNNSTSASSGYNSTSASWGDNSTSASSGNNSKSASSGYNSTSTAIGYRAVVKGDLGNLLMASEFVKKDDKYIPVGGKADLVDGKILKPNCWYIVEKGKWVEVDFTDNVFTYVLSNKKGVKKVKNEQGKILFVVSDDKGNSAHGETIAKAREDLIYKVVARSDVPIPKKATGKEWVGIYRAITGACGIGVKMFVDKTGKDLDDTYTAKEISELVQGQFGSEAFAKKIKEAA